MSKNLILSYQKSGLNFIRYCVEFLTKLPTPGQARLIGNKKNSSIMAFDRSHYPVAVDPKTNLIILIRDYKELAARPFRDSPGTPQKPHLRLKNIANRYRRFFEIYEKHPGKKAIIYYEDLLESLEPITEVVINMFDLQLKESLEVFIEKEKFHRKQSFKVGNKIFSDGTSKQYYQKNKTNKELKNMEREMKTTLGSLFKYVARY